MTLLIPFDIKNVTLPLDSNFITIKRAPQTIDLSEFVKYKNEILTQTFYSWNFFAMCFESRISVVNGIYFSFIGLLKAICPNFYVKEEFCTKENYLNFVDNFDLYLYNLRNRQDVKANIDIWNIINVLWNTMFYFRCYIEHMKDEPVNKYPDGCSFRRYLEIQSIVNNGGYKYQAIEMNDEHLLKRTLQIEF